MCLRNIELVNEKEVIAYKAFAIVNGALVSIFSHSRIYTQSYKTPVPYITHTTIKAFNPNSHVESYFYSCKNQYDAISLAQNKNDYWNIDIDEEKIVCKVKLSGIIYKGTLGTFRLPSYMSTHICVLDSIQSGIRI